MNRRELIATLGMAPLAGLLDAGTARATARQWEAVSPREAIRRRYFPNLELTTHEGRAVKLYDDLIKDKLVVINFMFTRCQGICPLVMHNLSRVQGLLGERLGRDIFMCSFSLKPEEDTPERLARHAAAHGVKPGWQLLTGRPADLELLRRNLGYVDPDPELDRDKSNHIGNVRYGNEPLMRWGACPGMSAPEWIAKSVLWLDWPPGERTGREGRR
jgi:protein SCO1